MSEIQALYCALSNLPPIVRIKQMSDIPVIDLRGLSTRDPHSMVRLTGEVAHACREVGFFYVRGHGVPHAILDEVMGHAHAFFAQPLARKDALKISAESDNQGYVGLRTEALDPGRNVDDKEAFNIRIKAHGRAHVFLCPELPGFDARLDRPMATLRLLHYPPASTIFAMRSFRASSWRRSNKARRPPHFSAGRLSGDVRERVQIFLTPSGLPPSAGSFHQAPSA
jgi:hypothetical protein